MNVIKETTDRWNKTGLLDGMKENDMSIMAVILELIVQELIKTCPPDNTPEKRKHEEFSGMILPIARRVFEQLEGKKFPDIKWLIEDYEKFYKERGYLIKDLNTHHAVDGEAEFCSMYCTDVVGRIKEKKI